MKALPLVLLAVAICGCGSGEPTLPEGQSLDFPKGKDYSARKAASGASMGAPATQPGMAPQDRRKAIDEYVRQQRAKSR